MFSSLMVCQLLTTTTKKTASWCSDLNMNVLAMHNSVSITLALFFVMVSRIAMTVVGSLTWPPSHSPCWCTLHHLVYSPLQFAMHLVSMWGLYRQLLAQDYCVPCFPEMPSWLKRMVFDGVVISAMSGDHYSGQWYSACCTAHVHKLVSELPSKAFFFCPSVSLSHLSLFPVGNELDRHGWIWGGSW